MGNTVNIKEATWTDPDFDPSHHAVYYARVLEIPAPRWSTYDAKALGIDPPEGTREEFDRGCISCMIERTSSAVKKSNRSSPAIFGRAPSFP